MTDIKLITQDQWVIIRWHRGSRCGPLSRVAVGLGYRDGYVGVLALFDTATEAMDAAAGEHGPDVEHTASRLRDLRFRLRSKHASIVSVTGDYQAVLQAFALATLTYTSTVFIIEEVVGQRSIVKQLEVVR